MTELDELTRQISPGGELAGAQVAAAADLLADAQVSEEAKADFLSALARRGETAGEIAEFARAFRARAVDPGVADLAAEAIDVVGTGGDHSGGFNISTLVTLVLASAGVRVMKHGNRGVTSKCGSADLMAGLGFDLQAAPGKKRAALERLGYVFFFAPDYHPAFRHIAPVRRALAARGQRTVFNLLGPLLNPGRPAHLLAGVFADEWVPRLAAAAAHLGLRSGLVVHGRIAAGGGIDEFTTATDNRLSGIGRLRDFAARWTAEDVGLPPAACADLQGGDLRHNLQLAHEILAGSGPAGLVDTIVANAALALWITGRTTAARDGLALARDLLRGGAVREKLADTRAFFST